MGAVPAKNVRFSKLLQGTGLKAYNDDGNYGVYSAEGCIGTGWLGCAGPEKGV